MNTPPKGRHAVYLGEIPDAQGECEKFWWPSSLVDLPDRLERVKLFESDLTLCHAAMVVRDFNRDQLNRAIPITDGRWAFLVFRLKEGAR